MELDEKLALIDHPQRRPDREQFGVGLSVGVALAAASVMLFAPAVLVLAGNGAWWVPAWADRFLPHLDIEGDQAPERDLKPAPPRRHKHDDVSL
ncbi:MAG: hypothetical protein ACXWES_06975 [Solirubrobacterales bacterium]